MTRAHPGPPRLVARTVEIADPGPLLERLPDPDSFVWLRDGEGLVGWGRAAQCHPAGEDRFLDASDWWREVVADADVTDEVRVPGTGLVCFGGFTFAGDAGDSVLAVPRVVLGRRNGTAWLTVVALEGETAEQPDLAPQPAPRPRRGSSSPAERCPTTSGRTPSPAPSPGSSPATSRRSCWPATW